VNFSFPACKGRILEKSRCGLLYLRKDFMEYGNPADFEDCI
jgi:hypothetical protein